MLYTLIVLAIYSALILFFVPLDRLAKAQAWVKAKVQQIKNKVDEN